MKKFLLACLWLSTANAAEPLSSAPGEAPSVWLNPGFYSYHFQRNMGFRDNNYGLGVQFQFSSSQSAVAGYYRNSEDFASHYIGWAWQPLSLGRARIGLVAVAMDGYPKMDNGRWFLGALPLVSFEYRRVGINFTVIPTYQNKINGAFVTQLKLRVW